MKPRDLICGLFFHDEGGAEFAVRRKAGDDLLVEFFLVFTKLLEDVSDEDGVGGLVEFEGFHDEIGQVGGVNYGNR